MLAVQLFVFASILSGVRAQITGNACCSYTAGQSLDQFEPYNEHCGTLLSPVLNDNKCKPSGAHTNIDTTAMFECPLTCVKNTAKTGCVSGIDPTGATACDVSSGCGTKPTPEVAMKTGGLCADDRAHAPFVTFDRDFAAKTRVITGTVTIRANRKANQLQGFRLYASDGTENMGGDAKGALNLATSCPPDANNEGWAAHVTGTTAWSSYLTAPCSNDSPYSPKCISTIPFTHCDEISIKPGSEGEYYITRYDNTADVNAANSFANNYGASESAVIFIPGKGTVRLVAKDLHASSTLIPETAPGTAGTDIATGNLGAETIFAGIGIITWASGSGGAKGFTLVYTPDYPTVDFSNYAMVDATSGFRVVPVTGDASATSPVAATGGSGLTEHNAAATFVETYDWVVPNATCTATTLYCPVPNTWGHIKYETPTPSDTPAEGRCRQYQNNWVGGDSDPLTAQNLETCGAGTNGNAPLEGRRGWAANCGGKSSYFYFEKMVCGATRDFHTTRSLIEDKVKLTPMESENDRIRAIYYTTKEPEHSANNVGGGITFIRPDYHVAPLLPPSFWCSCLTSMDAYSSLLSVVSKTPTPGAPETMDPEVLNSGLSKIIATLRVYNDPTYSIEVNAEGSDGHIPKVVQRFYLEVSTKFTRNKITIQQCRAAHESTLLNDSTALKPREDWCNEAMFDTQDEDVPTGVTHMDRISMKKFKFGVSTNVFLQCKIRACAERPCGVCGQRRQLAATRGLQSGASMAPMEGEMFAPPEKVTLNVFDESAMVFDPIIPSQPSAPASPSSSQSVPNVPAAPTSKPLQIESEIRLPLSPSWAIENREVVAMTLRETLALRPDEDLVITKISAVRRLSESRRDLQTQSVKIDFVVGFTQQARATQAETSLTTLKSGQTSALRTFTTELDAQLQAAGKPAVSLAPESVSFQTSDPASAEDNSAREAWSWDEPRQQAQSYYIHNLHDAAEKPRPESSSSTSLMWLILAGSFAGCLLLLCVWRQRQGSVKGDEGEAVPDAYNNKIAHLDFQ